MNIIEYNYFIYSLYYYINVIILFNLTLNCYCKINKNVERERKKRFL